MANPSYLGLNSMVGKVLAATRLAVTTVATVYSPATGKTAKIASASLTNMSGAAVLVSVYVVPAGGTAGVTNQHTAGYSLAAGGRINGDQLGLDGMMLGEGDAIAVQASVIDSVVVVLTGAESA